MKSALPTTAQPALQKRRFSTDEEDSDDESAIVRPEDLVRRWGGVHVRGDSLEPVTARPLELTTLLNLLITSGSARTSLHLAHSVRYSASI